MLDEVSVLGNKRFEHLNLSLRDVKAMLISYIKNGSLTFIFYQKYFFYRLKAFLFSCDDLDKLIFFFVKTVILNLQIKLSRVCEDKHNYCNNYCKN